MVTKHNHKCTMAFGRPSKEVGACPRCEELRSGSPARAGWQKAYYATKKRSEEMFREALKNHNCKTSGCAYVCVAFDW